jgi:hypothetical protein
MSQRAAIEEQPDGERGYDGRSDQDSLRGRVGGFGNGLWRDTSLGSA